MKLFKKKPKYIYIPTTDLRTIDDIIERNIQPEYIQPKDYNKTEKPSIHPNINYDYIAYPHPSNHNSDIKPLIYIKDMQYVEDHTYKGGGLPP